MKKITPTLVVVILIVSGGFLMVPSASSEIITRDVTYRHEDVQLQGYLAYDDNVRGERPGVMIVHQWMGLGDYEKSRARQLAEMGYLAFAADIYGADTRPQTTHEASLASSTFRENRNRYRRRLNVSLDRMKSFDRVNPDRTAAIGYCFGGTGVLELARGGADVDAVVSFHGGLSNPRPADAANIRATVQAHHGAADRNVTQEHVLSFWDEMENHATVDWDLRIYGDAPHGFTEPGTDAYVERADRLSWNAMTRLFEDEFTE